jgi:proton-translocating NADH-quinone oxidoreductase chain M
MNFINFLYKLLVEFYDYIYIIYEYTKNVIGFLYFIILDILEYILLFFYRNSELLRILFYIISNFLLINYIILRNGLLHFYNFHDKYFWVFYAMFFWYYEQMVLFFYLILYCFYMSIRETYIYLIEKPLLKYNSVKYLHYYDKLSIFFNLIFIYHIDFYIILFSFIKLCIKNIIIFLITNIGIIFYGFLNIFITIIWICFPYPMLFKFILLPFIAILNLLIIKKTNYDLLKLCSLFWSFILFNSLLFIIIFVKYYKSPTIYLLKNVVKFNLLPLNYGIDIISVLFLLLTCFLFIIVFLSALTLEMKELKKFLIIIYIIYFFLLNIFLVQNLFLFFFFFESIVFPMYFLIMMGGSRFQKVKAAYYFFFFTVIGSLFMFISINYLFLQFNTFNFDILFHCIKENCSIIEQRYLWLSFFLSFAIKIPMFPFHTWLPEAHVEAPTIGSVILAGILLKLGSYGFIRIPLYLFPEANVFFSSYVHTLCIISIFYASFVALRQTDIKRIIAYASIAHMNLIVLGIFSFNTIGIYGAIFQSISHGLVSSGLFLLIGMLYNRYKTRLISYYSGLAQIMPIFSSYFLFFILANMSFPLTSNFIGELLLFIGISKLKFNVLFFSLLSIILNTIYSLWFCNRLLYGNSKSHLLIKFKDLTAIELFLISLLFLSILILGIFPNILNIGFVKSLSSHLMFLELLHKPYM